MEISVRIPTPLRRLTNGQDKVTLSSTTIKDMVDDIRIPQGAKTSYHH